MSESEESGARGGGLARKLSAAVLLLLLLSPALILTLQFSRSRARLERLAGTLETGMSRATVEAQLIDLERIHLLPGSRPSVIRFADPARTPVQSYEHIQVSFDANDRVTAVEIIHDP